MSKQEKHNRSLHDFLNKEIKEPEDAFEKEAREGFDMLENHGEAFELKAATDARVNKEVFVPKRERTVFYWAAAASVALFTGFAVYFFNDFSQTQPLAVTQMEIKKEADPLPEQPQIVATPAAPVAEKQENKKLSGDDGVKKTTPEARALEKNEKAAVNEEEKKEEKDKPAGKSNALQMTAASAEPVKDQESIASGANQEDNIKANTENEGAPAEQKRSKKSKQAEQVPAAAPTRAQSDYEIADVNIRPEYPGGHDQLLKEVLEKLKKKNSLVKFTATLFINGDNGGVEKIEFERGDDLSKAQKKVISEELSTLKKFLVPSPANRTLTYELQFKP
jgi:hypothetical protein